MTHTDSRPDWEFKDRDIAILMELTREPTLSSRELMGILEADYGIEVSHVTISQSIREMREAGVFREAIIPNEDYLFFGLHEYKFDPRHFAEGWREAMEYIRNDRHTLFYFLSDGEYQWKTITVFRDREQESKWIHEFYKNHGKVVSNLRNSVVTNVLKFETDPDVFRYLEYNGS